MPHRPEQDNANIGIIPDTGTIYFYLPGVSLTAAFLAGAFFAFVVEDFFFAVLVAVFFFAVAFLVAIVGVFNFDFSC